MNQQTSKALRKATGFKPWQPRKYKRINYSNGNHTYVAVGDRAYYQAAKADYLEVKRNGTEGKSFRKRGAPEAVGSDVQIISRD